MSVEPTAIVVPIPEPVAEGEQDTRTESERILARIESKLDLLGERMPVVPVSTNPTIDSQSEAIAQDTPAVETVVIPDLPAVAPKKRSRKDFFRRLFS